MATASSGASAGWPSSDAPPDDAPSGTSAMGSGASASGPALHASGTSARSFATPPDSCPRRACRGMDYQRPGDTRVSCNRAPVSGGSGPRPRRRAQAVPDLAGWGLVPGDHEGAAFGSIAQSLGNLHGQADQCGHHLSVDLADLVG